MPTLWKQQVPLHPEFFTINQCLQDDWFLLPLELKQQQAHAQALHQAGILTEAEVKAIQSGLDRISWEYGSTDCPASETEDIHTWVENMLTHLVGQPGKKIHTARSRNDQVATMIKLYMISSGQQLAKTLHEFIETSCQKAEQWSDLAFPLQTHTQFAAPGNAGLWVLRYATAFDRLSQHLDFCVKQWQEYCPLGSGAVAGSSIKIDRRLQAQWLGFKQPSLNALDSTTTRDECLDMLALAAQMASHLQSLATDVILFSQTPLKWIIYPSAFGTGSSMMPNKTNPDAMELLRGECVAIASAHNQALMLLKGLPSGYNRDLQCLKPLVTRTVEKLSSLLSMAIAFLKELEFDELQLARSLQLGQIGATLRMEQKVSAGVPLREAHHQVAAEIASSDPQSPETDFINLSLYQTIGSANPGETRRVAQALLQGLRKVS